jgi:hypothetical protein
VLGLVRDALSPVVARQCERDAQIGFKDGDSNLDDPLRTNESIPVRSFRCIYGACLPLAETSGCASN